MKIIRLIPFWLACLAGGAHADNSLDIAAQLARGGAYQLAYQRVERDQPLTVTSEWPHWEALRLSLLVELQRDPDALQRAAQLAAQLPAAAVAPYLPAARAALKQQDAALARRYLAKYLWGRADGGTNSEPALSGIVGEAARALDAERATLFLNDEKTNELWSKIGIGLEGQEIRLPNQSGIAGAVFSGGKPLNIPDAYADPRFNPASDRASGYFTRAILGVPVIAADGKIIGVLQALNKRGGPFNTADEARLSAAAMQAAQALTNAATIPKIREARRLVIRSYLAERQANLAYLAMLRYRQDYAPLSAEEIAAFGEQLVLADGLAEAANWLVQLDEAHPLNLLVRLKSGALTAEGALATARLAIDPPTAAAAPPDKGSRKALKLAPALPPAKPTGKELAGYWAIVGIAGTQLKNPALQAESLERRLNLADLGEDGLYGANAAALWRSYEELGLDTANRAQLLIGEDNRWLELAVDRAAPAPLAARALFAFLVQRGASAQTRDAARIRLAAMLMQKGLDVAAVRLFAIAPDTETLLLGHLPPGETTHRDELFNALGMAAASRGEHLQAAEYFLRASGSRARKLAAEQLGRAGLIGDARRLYEGKDQP